MAVGGWVVIVGLLVVAGLWLVMGCGPAPRRFVAAEAESVGVSWMALVWCGVGLGSVGAVVVGWPGCAVSLVLAAGVGWREAGRRRGRAMAAERVVALVGFVDALAVGVRGGRSLGVAVVEAEGVGGLGTLVAVRVRAGWPVVDAVDEVVGVGGADERLVCVTVRALESTGAGASDALERLVEALGERRSGREAARTQAQQALSSSLVLSVLPLVFGVGVAAVEPAVAGLYVSSWWGAGCVGVAGVLSLAGWEWQQRLLGSVVP